ncbi:hypothetical protein [Methanosarcina sp. UBA411]|uniref:hypothetical protein n=1 Tax=Methanosarcina sp. UBA411 TaxID=1915589 RepID=UPI0025F02E30|nr:hypothetical protein [Methanosarcina sp. UBA411]
MSIVDIVMSCAKSNNLIFTSHSIDMLELRQNRIVPDKDGLRNLLSTQLPVYVEKQSNVKFKLFYSIDDKYDLITVVVHKSFNPDKISIITVHQQEAKRRRGNDATL